METADRYDQWNLGELVRRMNRDLLIGELRRDESTRLKVYDDKTGRPIVPGSVVQGHPTIGTGRSLDIDGITEAEDAHLLDNDIDRVTAELLGALPLFAKLDDTRQRCLANMAVNMGTHGVLGFHDAIRYMTEERWEMAARAMEDSDWFREVPVRAGRLIAMIRTGAV